MLQTPYTYALMALTILTSLAGFGSRHVIRDYAESPYDIVRHGRWYQLVSSGFLHADLGHLFLNMFTLYFFGRAVEMALGATAFLVVYLGSLVCGSLLTLAVHRNNPGYRAVGASGAISGVVFSFVLFAPRASIYLFLLPIGIPAFVFAILWIAVSLAGMKKRFGRIGHEAHLGGAIGGLILTLLLRPGVLRHFLAHF